MGRRLTSSALIDGMELARLRCNMDIRTERDTEIRAEGPDVYEPPMLDEVGGFTALTRMDPDGLDPDRFAYFPL